MTMDMEPLHRSLDLQQEELDPDLFAATLAVNYVTYLMNSGGGNSIWPNLEATLHPYHIERFVTCVVEIARKANRFEGEWRKLQQSLPSIHHAWSRGQAYFEAHLLHAKIDSGEMEYFSIVDFAVEWYAYPAAQEVYQDEPLCREWFVSGYMLAWQDHFLSEDEISL